MTSRTPSTGRSHDGIGNRPHGHPGWSVLRWGMPAIVCLLLATTNRGDTDWPYMVAGARSLGLRVYATHSKVQVGPVALAVVRFAHWITGSYSHIVGATLVAALLPLGLIVVDRMAGWRPRPASELLSLALVTIGWMFVAGRGHVDDAIAIVAALWALSAARAGRPLQAGALVGLAAAAKPWGLIFLPILLVLRHHRPRAAAAAAAVTAVAWLPFVVAAPTTLDALRPALPLHPASLLGFVFGLHAPLWVRPVQIAAALGVGTIAARRGNWYAVPLAVIAARILADPFIWDYYAGGLIVAALLVERVRRHRYPWLGALGFGLVLSLGLVPASLNGLIADRWEALPIVVTRTTLIGLVILVGLRLSSRGDQPAGFFTPPMAADSHL